MRRYVVYPCLLLYVHLILYDTTDTCPELNESENLSCLVNYADKMNCIWYRGSNSGNGPFLLTAKNKNEGDEDRECKLVIRLYEGNSYSCNITDLFTEETDEFDITVQDSTTGSTLSEIKGFIPQCNIKLDPPELSYNVNGSIYKIVWSGNENFAGESTFQYELQFKSEASSWQEAKQKKIYNSDVYVEILSSEFEKDSVYDVRIRCKTESQDYKSQWSEWSSELKIEIFEKDRSHTNINHIIVVIALLIMTLILLYLVFCSNLSSRIKIPFLKNVPTAADFFQPLYHVHNGNFQDWTKYPNKYVQTKEGGQFCNNTDTDLYSSTVLYFQKEIISPIKLEASPPNKDVPPIHETCDSMSLSDPLNQKTVSLNELYPSFFPDFPICIDNDDENNTVFEMDFPTEFFSYDGAYIANSQEMVE